MNYPITGWWPIDIAIAGILFLAGGLGLGTLIIGLLWIILATIRVLSRREPILWTAYIVIAIAILGIVAQYYTES